MTIFSGVEVANRIRILLRNPYVICTPIRAGSEANKLHHNGIAKDLYIRCHEFLFSILRFDTNFLSGLILSLRQI